MKLDAKPRRPANQAGRGQQEPCWAATQPCGGEQVAESSGRNSWTRLVASGRTRSYEHTGWADGTTGRPELATFGRSFVD